MRFLSRLINTSRLSRVLLIRILLFSGLFTVIITAIQLSLNHQKYTDELQQKSQELIELSTPSLTLALWDLMENSALVFSEGMMRSGYYKSILIKNETKKDIAFLGQIDKNADKQTFNLIAEVEKRPVIIGTIEYQIDTDQVKQKTIDEFIIILISQFIKTFFVSIFILFIIHKLVIRHLNDISNWLESFKPESSFSPLTLVADKDSSNEMVKLKSAISEMGQQVHKHTTGLEKIVTERTAELEKLAYTDSLTGVANRCAFLQVSNEELSRSRRLSYDVCVMMLDLDHFKVINDTYGHDAGDKVLKQVSEAMNNCLRKEDTLGRIGGEEFAIIAPGVDKGGMHKLASRLQQSIALLDFSFLPENKNITVSIGYTKVSNDEDFKEALKRADKYLYSAKNSGRNTFITDKGFVPSIVS
ncbi:diguanylate cyclase [Colwellia psychrerythraea]|uniref:diguanylate cyclase n=1 Tax=Colwellia psychrerythraea (strain 34H / ATCC BAA-681) TaxID=167879 RepID=Q482A7_COLP3|nr:sensor domain-containing diguanylate cyclase [Colwellia psychrerythraea]AAZ27179.1 GGDEF domain protein [Colwellia psychrerythraea 34H]